MVWRLPLLAGVGGAEGVGTVEEGGEQVAGVEGVVVGGIGVEGVGGAGEGG